LDRPAGRSLPPQNSWQTSLSLLGPVVVVSFLLLAIFGPTIAPYHYDDLIGGGPPVAVLNTHLGLTASAGCSAAFCGARGDRAFRELRRRLPFVGTTGLFMVTLGWVDEIIAALDSLLSILP
jgi:hypothetical protein